MLIKSKDNIYFNVSIKHNFVASTLGFEWIKRHFTSGKLSTNGPPKTSQSPCNHLFYDFQLRLHFMNCVPIFWIERPIASPESAAIPTQSIQSTDNSVQCRIATTWHNPLQFNAIRHNWGELKVDCACLCDTNVMQVTKQYLKHQLVCSVERAKRIF